MDEVMDGSGELTFTVIEIDLDYEFDAARYFDFTRDETPEELIQSELFFESGRSYPPSPFVTELIMRENTLHQQLCTSPRSRGEDDMSMEGSDSDNALEQHCSRVDMNYQGCTIMKKEILNNLQGGSMLQHLPTGLTFPNQLKKDEHKAQAKSFAKPSIPRVSTLMKPTASQLAKQNRPHQIGDPRFSKFDNKDKQKCGNTPIGIEMQAAKRQKLEGGGLLHKDGGTKHQNVLIHKVSKKEEPNTGKSTQAKFKITIPMEPELVTRRRAYRMRPKDTLQPEYAAPDNRRFKARPLNKKILDVPSSLLPKRSTPRLPEFQEFNLKTKERASQHSLATSSSLVHEGSAYKTLNRRPIVHSVAERTGRESRRTNAIDDTIHSFKARPLNKKIFSSKGDIGVLRNIKKEVTVPVEFNFQTEKRIQRTIHVDDLFNKLSLNELQPKTRSQLPLPRSSCLPSKGAKENRSVTFQQEHKIKHSVKEYTESGLGTTHHTSNTETVNVELLPGMNRGMGIRFEQKICLKRSSRLLIDDRPSFHFETFGHD